MLGKRIFQNLMLSRFLSFGDEQEIELQPLNLLIGPNGSGKSNLIEAFRILNATPEDIGKPIREGGGISEYVWKGDAVYNSLEIGVKVNWESGDFHLSYGLSLFNNGLRLELLDEAIKPISDNATNSLPEFIYSLMDDGRGEIYPKLPIASTSTNAPSEVQYARDVISVQSERSILSQFKDPSRYPAISHLQKVFSEIHFYTGWNLGRYGTLRYPQKADLPSNRLLEDGSNLGLVLINKPFSLRQEITEKLKIVLPTVEEIFPKVEGGTVPLYIREKGFSTPTPAARLSEGTLRYLCLLTLLLDPTPPPIICLEEPEAGLHPHVVSQIAELLIDASQRTQLIVTTHSDALISGLSEHPEAVIVCERDEEGTHLKRLEPAQIRPWLDRYALGDLWREGHLGGTAW